MKNIHLNYWVYFSLLLLNITLFKMPLLRRLGDPFTWRHKKKWDLGTFSLLMKLKKDLNLINFQRMSAYFSGPSSFFFFSPLFVFFLVSINQTCSLPTPPKIPGCPILWELNISSVKMSNYKLILKLFSLSVFFIYDKGIWGPLVHMQII